MPIPLRFWPRALALKLALVSGVGALVLALVLANPAQAQETGTGAEATKTCPGLTATIGQTITCSFTVENTGDDPAEVTTLTETSPIGTTPVDLTCTTAAGAEINDGDILAPDTLCSGTFQVTIANNPALCGTTVVDRVDIALLYPDGDRAGAFAEETTQIRCPDIEITKMGDELSKVGDSVTYTFEICNEGDIILTRGTVNDTLLGDIAQFFPATLAVDQCVTVTSVPPRTVLATDPDPLTNTVTATYNAGSAGSATDTDSHSTNLFQPSVDVTKTCTPAEVDVGGVVTCTIVVTDTSSDDAPPLVNGTIVDTLTGDLLAAVNPARVSSTCAAALPDPVGAPQGTCTIVTRRTVLATDPDPVCNTVTVRYNPQGFPNIITDTATACVPRPPDGGEGCTPGFWKQDQHFDSWVGFAPGASFEEVFGVEDVTVRAGGQDTIDDPTLLEALNATGGGVNALARHAVAALLNASNPDVDFEFTTAEVIALVQEAFETGDFERIKDILAAENERGCPLN